MKFNLCGCAAGVGRKAGLGLGLGGLRVCSLSFDGGLSMLPKESLERGDSSGSSPWLRRGDVNALSIARGEFIGVSAAGAGAASSSSSSSGI